MIAEAQGRNKEPLPPPLHCLLFPFISLHLFAVSTQIYRIGASYIPPPFQKKRQRGADQKLISFSFISLLGPS